MLLLASSGVQAALLFEQAPLPTPAVGPNPAIVSGPTLFVSSVADNFILASDALLEDITFWLAVDSSFGSLPLPTEFELAIFPDNGFGLPDLTLPLLNLPVVSTDTFLSVFGGPVVYQHSYTLSTPLALMGGIPYYLQVAALPANFLPLLWQFSSINSGFAPYVINPDLTVASPDPSANMAFALNGTPQGTVPEPASLLLILPGLGLLLGRRRRVASV